MNDCTVVSRFKCAIDVVMGMLLGHTSTQFCELPHEVMPPDFMISLRRTSLFIFPVGCALNRRTCWMGAGPMKLDLGLTFGHASKQQPQVMHLDSS